jgi:hypothetical protein
MTWSTISNYKCLSSDISLVSVIKAKLKYRFHEAAVFLHILQSTLNSCMHYHILFQDSMLSDSSIAQTSEVSVYAMLLLPIAGNYKVWVWGTSDGTTSIRNFIKISPAILEMKHADEQTISLIYLRFTDIEQITHRKVVCNRNYHKSCYLQKCVQACINSTLELTPLDFHDSLQCDICSPIRFATVNLNLQ